MQINYNFIRSICQGRTVTLKLKTVAFKVTTHAHSLAQHTADSQLIYSAASDVLRSQIDTTSKLKLRLMGEL